MTDGKSWRSNSVFSMIITCQGQSRSLYIRSSNALNGVSQEFVNQIGLAMVPYKVTCVNGAKMMGGFQLWEVIQEVSRL